MKCEALECMNGVCKYSLMCVLSFTFKYTFDMGKVIGENEN